MNLTLELVYDFCLTCLFLYSIYLSYKKIPIYHYAYILSFGFFLDVVYKHIDNLHPFLTVYQPFIFHIYVLTFSFYVFKTIYNLVSISDYKVLYGGIYFLSVGISLYAVKSNVLTLYNPLLIVSNSSC